MVSSDDVSENIERAEKFTNLASEKGAKLVVLPQLFLNPWFAHTIEKENFKFAVSQDSDEVANVREIAKENNVTLVAPIFEVSDDKYYNTALIISPEGELIGKYRKVHVPQLPLWEERSYFTAGSEGFPVFETPVGRLGVLMCWDVFFPEAFRTLALNGAELVAVPTASAYFHSKGKWERAVCASAHANGFFVIRVNRTGKESKNEFYGGSFVAGPDGEFVLEPAGSQEGISLAECDLGVIAAVRNEWVFLKDRRPDQYRIK